MIAAYIVLAAIGAALLIPGLVMGGIGGYFLVMLGSLFLCFIAVVPAIRWLLSQLDWDYKMGWPWPDGVTAAAADVEEKGAAEDRRFSTGMLAFMSSLTVWCAFMAVNSHFAGMPVGIFMFGVLAVTIGLIPVSTFIGYLLARILRG